MAEGHLSEQAPQRRTVLRHGLRLGGLAALALVAGCQSIIPKGGDRPQTTGPTQPRPDPSNVVAGDNARHRVALLVPISGPNSDIGQSLANATLLALLDAKADNVRMTTYDTAGGAAEAARRAIADGNRLILGPLLGEDVTAAAAVARPANVPVVSYSNDSGVAGRNVFVMGPMPSQSVDRVVRYARSKGMVRIAGMVPDTVYGRRVGDALSRSVAQSGGTLVGVQRYAGTSASMQAAAKALAESGTYDAVLIGDTGRAALSLAPILRRNGAGTAKFLGTELWNTESQLSASPALRGAWFASIADGNYKTYGDRYRVRFGKAPFRMSSLGYDSVLLVVRISREWKIGAPFPVAKLTNPEGFGGVDGAFRFTSTGVTERMMEVQEVRGGSFSTIEAAPRSFAR